MTPRPASRVLAASMPALLAPAAVHACAVCSALSSESNRKAFLETTVLLSLLPLGLIAWGLFWVARRGHGVLRAEFRESDEDPPAAD